MSGGERGGSHGCNIVNWTNEMRTASIVTRNFPMGRKLVYGLSNLSRIGMLAHHKRIAMDRPQSTRPRLAPKIAKDATELVGNTPMVFLDKISRGLPGRIAAKLEFMNPTCSVKDRAGLNMIKEAEKKGILIPGKSVLIECTSGNTGISMAQVGAVRGYQVIIIMGDGNSVERRAMMRAFGAELILVDKALGMEAAVERAHELAKRIPNAVFLNQFTDENNPDMHEKTTGPEIWEQTEGKVAAAVFGIGSGGTMAGTGRFLKQKNPTVEIYGAEPFESSVINELPKGDHWIQGMGAGLIPDILDQTVMDECLRVKSDDAVAMARRLAKEEGLMVGISSGANACAAVELASLEKFRGKLIVTALADFGERYLSTVLYSSILEDVKSQKATTLEEDIKKYCGPPPV